MKPSEYRELLYDPSTEHDLHQPCPFLPLTKQMTGMLWDYLNEHSFETIKKIHPTWLHIYLWELVYCPVARSPIQPEYNRFINFRTHPVEYISVILHLQDLSAKQLPYETRPDFDDLVRLFQRTIV